MQNFTNQKADFNRSLPISHRIHKLCSRNFINIFNFDEKQQSSTFTKKIEKKNEVRVLKRPFSTHISMKSASFPLSFDQKIKAQQSIFIINFSH